MRYLLLSIGLCLTFTFIKAQQITPYSYDQYQKLSKDLYNKGTRFHTSLKPVIGDDTVLNAKLDSLLSVNTEKEYKAWAWRKLFNEHLIQIEKEDFKVYMDFLPDFLIGRDVSHNITTWNNTRGYQISGTIGKKFSFYTSGYENQARFNDYLNRYIDTSGVIPGMVNVKNLSKDVTKDWAYATAILNYTANKYFTFTLGHDKNFIGDGYRSMLMSDVAAAYPYFKITSTLGNVKYMAMWAQFQDPKSPEFSYDNGFRKKWGVFHYLDWNVNNRLSLGFFDSVIWQDADSTGKRGFDPTYLNPIIFLRTVEGMNGSPDNALIGFTGKYKLFSNLTLYGQIALDEFTFSKAIAGNGYWGNKFAFQLGLRGFDAFKVKGLNYLAEFNTARPFTYSQRTSLLNYGHYVQALAHPMGANFREFVTIWNYQFKRWNFYGQFNYANYGLNIGPLDYGQNINQSYNERFKDEGYKTGDGLGTNFYYGDARVSYTINPKYNLRLELGAITRTEVNRLGTDRTNQITFGLRSSFRNIYADF
ncbi:gliding motility protein RemB [Pedobacter sp. MW01-1-1]|uniref:gliding motility protein RemB n=1 Tax=Pedobacter sp. MW01-1-1 TaxID=3383027 RepID=UPI003FF0406E